MTTESPLRQFAVSTVSFFYPKLAFKAAHECNSLGMGTPLGVEVYANKKITPKLIAEWMNEYPLARTTSIHLEVPYNQKEVDHQVSGQASNNFHQTWWSPLAHRLIYAKTGTADSMHGLALAESVAESREVDINLHINTLVGFLRHGNLEQLQKMKRNVSVEQSVRHDFLYTASIAGYTPDMLYDPEKTIELMQNYRLNRFRLGLDHLISHQTRQNIDPKDVLDSELVKKHTVALNIAGAGNRRIDYSDPYWKSLFNKIGQTNFAHPLYGVFTFNPLEAFLGRMSAGGWAEFILDNIEKINKWQR